MAAILCGLVTAGLFSLSIGVNAAWPLAWVAIAPLLWLAYGSDGYWRLITGAVAAVVPLTALALLPFFHALPFAAIVEHMLQFIWMAMALVAALWLAREAKMRLHPVLSLIAFPAFWTSAAYILWLVTGGDTSASPVFIVYSQIEFPMLAQSASLFGMWSVLFLLSLFANGMALVLRDKSRAVFVAGVTLGVFAANLAFGAMRFHTPQAETVRIGLAAQDQPLFSRMPIHADAVAAATRYSDVVAKLATNGARVVILPELIGYLTPDWRERILTPLESAAHTAGIPITVGFATVEGAPPNLQFRNIALTVHADGAMDTYAKRHPLAPLDQSIPGDQPGLLGDGRAVAICKDMDFPATIRGDAQHGVRLMYVPAADFDNDGWLHARMSIFRGIENGFAVARAARNGVLTLTDAQGRSVARGASGTNEIASLVGEVSLGSGDTLYRRTGDVFAWGCLALLSAFSLWLIREKIKNANSRPLPPPG